VTPNRGMGPCEVLFVKLLWPLVIIMMKIIMTITLTIITTMWTVHYLGEVWECSIVVQDVREVNLWSCQHINLMFAVINALLKTREVPTNTQRLKTLLSWWKITWLLQSRMHYPSQYQTSPHYRHFQLIDLDKHFINTLTNAVWEILINGDGGSRL